MKATVMRLPRIQAQFLKMKTKIKFLVLLLISLLVAVGSIEIGNKLITAYSNTKSYVLAEDLEDMLNFASISYAKAEEPTMKEWVKQRVVESGLNWEDIDCLIQNESGWNQYAYNINWHNYTTDFGLWMINSVHKDTISVECRWDYKCSTEWAINKIKKDGNYNAWYGYKNCQ